MTDSAPATRADSLALRAVLASITLCVMLVPLNSTMIAIALPDIMREFHVEMSTAGWLVTAYLVTMATLQLVAGQLGDQFGRRKFMLGGQIYFGLASLFAALSPNIAWLLFFRTQQAVAGAILVTNGVALAFHVVPADRRGHSLGWVNAAIVLAAAIGPLVGGSLIAVAGWQAIFWVNLPLVSIALVLGWSTIPRDAPRVTQNQRSKRSFPFQIINRRSFVSANMAIALSNLASYVTLLALPILLSRRAGWSSFQTGMILAVMSAAVAIFSPLGGRWADRMGRRLPVVLGLAVLTIALLPLVWGNTEIEISILAISLAGAGVGQGLATSAMQTAALESVATDQAGIASGMSSTSRYLGSIIGTSVLTVLLASAQIENFKVVFGMTVLAALGATLIGLGIDSSSTQKEPAAN